jgi:hypothetical protein
VVPVELSYDGPGGTRSQYDIMVGSLGIYKSVEAEGRIMDNRRPSDAIVTGSCCVTCCRIGLRKAKNAARSIVAFNYSSTVAVPSVFGENLGVI